MISASKLIGYQRQCQVIVDRKTKKMGTVVFIYSSLLLHCFYSLLLYLLTLRTALRVRTVALRISDECTGSEHVAECVRRYYASK